MSAPNRKVSPRKNSHMPTLLIATRLFADPDFDGDPSIETEQVIDVEGRLVDEETVVTQEEVQNTDTNTNNPVLPEDDINAGRRKFYFDGGQVEISVHLVYELDSDGNQIRVVKLTDYTAESVRNLYSNAMELSKEWSKPETYQRVVRNLGDRGIDFENLAESVGQPDADVLDLLCHVAFNSPLLTRRQRAERLKSNRKDFLISTDQQQDKYLMNYWKNM